MLPDAPVPDARTVLTSPDTIGIEAGRGHRAHLAPFIPVTDESSFATVKLRTKATKGAGSKKAALAMAYKLLDAAEERRRRFNGHALVTDVLAGAQVKDGIKVIDDDTTTTDEKVAA